MGALAINFIKAVLIGLAASIPLGPVGLVCIQKTLNHGRWSGFSVGAGAALGDTFYASIALLSVSFVSDFLERNRDWVIFVGGIIILLIGLQIALKNPIKDVRQPKKSMGNGRVQDGLRGLLMTISNPGALVLMLGLFTFFRFDLGDGPKVYVLLLCLCGVLLGTLLWWFTLSSCISLFRKRFHLRQLLVINRISGFLIALIGLASLAEGLALLVFHQSLL